MAHLHSHLPARIYEYDTPDGDGIFCSYSCLAVQFPKFYEDPYRLHITDADEWRRTWGDVFDCHNCESSLLPSDEDWGRAHCPECGQPMYQVTWVSVHGRELYYCGYERCNRHGIIEYQGVTGGVVHTSFMTYDVTNHIDTVIDLPNTVIAELIKAMAREDIVMTRTMTRYLTHRWWRQVWIRYRDLYPAIKGDFLNPFPVAFVTDKGQPLSEQSFWKEASGDAFGIV